jgi:hypothetical protein
LTFSAAVLGAGFGSDSPQGLSDSTELALNLSILIAFFMGVIVFTHLFSLLTLSKSPKNHIIQKRINLILICLSIFSFVAGLAAIIYGNRELSLPLGIIVFIAFINLPQMFFEVVNTVMLHSRKVKDYYTGVV